jgi:hypothetical protein
MNFFIHTAAKLLSPQQISKFSTKNFIFHTAEYIFNTAEQIFYIAEYIFSTVE